MKEKKIISTVILSILIVPFMVWMIRLLPINLTEALSQVAASIPETELEGEGLLIYYGVSVFTVGVVGIGIYFIAILILLAGFIFFFVAFHNRKSTLKGVRYYNYFLAFCCVFLFVSSLVKMILWSCGY